MNHIPSTSFKYLTNATCEDTDNWLPENFDILGIPYDRRHNYPLTTTESKYLGDGMKSYKGTLVLNGYSVLHEGKKYFAPTIEQTFDPADSQSTLKNLQEIAMRAAGEFYKCKLEGYFSIDEFDGPQEDRHTLILLVPVEIVEDMTANQYNEWLATFYG